MPRDSHLQATLARFEPYERHVCEVEILAQQVLAGRATVAPDAPMLNGLSSRVLRDTVELSARRQLGSFFTTSTIRDGKFQDALRGISSPSATAFDPTCGAGDLLLAWVSLLPRSDTLASTISAWGAGVSGTDINSHFVRLARARLVLAAASHRLPVGETKALEECFPLVRVTDGLAALRGDWLPDTVMLNPPFGAMAAPEWYLAGSGGVSSAALYVYAWLSGARPGQQLVAVLPEVLRSGARYRRWREAVDAAATLIRLESLGQFHADVDIDVFLLVLRAGPNKKATDSWLPRAPTRKGLPFETSVHVGTVVPHRHHESGPSVPYLTATNLSRRDLVERVEARRQYAGKLFKPPFVAVRRTSRPGQAPRAFATVVNSAAEVAVENHLIVLRPSDGQLQSCELLRDWLVSKRVTAWLDTRLRGRHLTCDALREVVGEAR
jgi:hypothetical protein